MRSGGAKPHRTPGGKQFFLTIPDVLKKLPAIPMKLLEFQVKPNRLFSTC
jgi:hypothetical protein